MASRLWLAASGRRDSVHISGFWGCALPGPRRTLPYSDYEYYHRMKMRAERRALDKIYKRRDRYDIPDWQREEVWGLGKKQKLIDTLLRGWKLPKFYFLKTSKHPEAFEVLDGQQRLSAIWEFLDGD